jgi:hypothetical protein
MSDTQRLTMTLNLIHGDPIRFCVDVDKVRKRNLASNIEAAMSSSYLGVVLNGKLSLVPTSNLESVELEPIEEMVLLKGVVTDAKPVD